MGEIVRLLVEVVKTPIGSAPEEFRKAWVGLRLWAKANPFPYTGPRYDPPTLRPFVRKEAVLVPVDDALERLGRKSSEAAAWYYKNYPIPPQQDFVFNLNEVQIIWD